MDIDKLSRDEIEILSEKIHKRAQVLAGEETLARLKSDPRVKDFLFIVYDDAIDQCYADDLEHWRVGFCNDPSRIVQQKDELFAYCNDGIPEDMEELYGDLCSILRVPQDPKLEKTRALLLSLGLKEAKPAWHDNDCMEERERELSKYYAKETK